MLSKGRLHIVMHQYEDFRISPDGFPKDSEWFDSDKLQELISSFARHFGNTNLHVWSFILAAYMGKQHRPPKIHCRVAQYKLRLNLANLMHFA